MMEGRLYTFFNNLTNAKDDDEMFTILTELNIILESKDSHLKQELLQLNLNVFCKELHGLNGRLREIGKRLLKKIFELVGSMVPLCSISEVLIEGINNDDDEEIKLLYLKYLESACCRTEEIQFLVNDLDNSTPLLHCVAKNMTDNSVGVAKQAAKVIKSVFTSCPSGSKIFSEKFMKVFMEYLERGAVVRFRIYEVFLEVFLSRNEIMQNEYVKTITESLVNEMNSNDILSQLNCLDMLSQIACASPDALESMSSGGTLQNVSNIFEAVESDPLKQMLIPGAVKFFGTIAIKNPMFILQNYPAFVDFIFANMKSEDPTLVALCFETIAHICNTADGLKILSRNTEQFQYTMRSAGDIINSPAEEPIKKRVLDALSVLFSKNAAVIDQSIETIKEMAYRSVAQNPVTRLLECCKQPFSAIHCSSLEVLSHLSAYYWTEQDMAVTPGFIEYLLDRRTEHEKEGKELKYNILKILAKSSTSKDNFGVDYNNRILQYVKEGPFYSAQETAVEFDEAN